MRPVRPCAPSARPLTSSPPLACAMPATPSSVYHRRASAPPRGARDGASMNTTCSWDPGCSRWSALPPPAPLSSLAGAAAPHAPSGLPAPPGVSLPAAPLASPPPRSSCRSVHTKSRTSALEVSASGRSQRTAASGAGGAAGAPLALGPPPPPPASPGGASPPRCALSPSGAARGSGAAASNAARAPGAAVPAALAAAAAAPFLTAAPAAPTRPPARCCRCCCWRWRSRACWAHRRPGAAREGSGQCA
jgi:hypothetical protein